MTHDTIDEVARRVLQSAQNDGTIQDWFIIKFVADSWAPEEELKPGEID